MRTLIIAEAGVNHNGSLELAKKLIDVGADAGADYVKFQTFKTEKLVSRQARRAEYQIRNTKSAKDSAQFDMLKKVELSEKDFAELKKYAQKRKVKFLSTGFDLDSLSFLNRLGMDFFKVPSGEITNLPYLIKIASFRKPVILSTGMCDMSDIEAAINVLENNGVRRSAITVLHCNTEYPTPMKDVNLNAMTSIGRAFGVKVGYSDHTEGIVVPIAAVAMGANVIEKHFTLDKGMDGPDHKASLEPIELTNMIKAIRAVDSAKGDGIKRPSPSEQKNAAIARKSIHLKNDMPAGAIVKQANLEMLRPGDGISPMNLKMVVGKRLVSKLQAGHKLAYSDLTT